MEITITFNCEILMKSSFPVKCMLILGNVNTDMQATYVISNCLIS